ncbi:MAG: class I SAM-dependent methyltransferase [Chloroflexi bacterium]|nr:class I SAM-dependent methyltransferase [Chloroflexota bacterium]
MCASSEWAETVEQRIIPWVLEDVELGDDVLEVGPGPGSTTNVLRHKTPRLTAVEIDEDLAASLRDRLAGSNVEVLQGDATALAFPAGRFSAALSFTMLHHVPTAELQDRLLGEVARVLKKGGVFAGIDSRDGDDFRALHIGDICVPVDPATLAARLTRAGFREAKVDTNEFAVRFRAKK